MSAPAPFDGERLGRLLDRPELKRLIDALQRRLEWGIRGSVLTLTHVGAEERRALEGLLGRAPGSGRSVRVPLDALEGLLREAGVAPDLATAVAALRGPIRDRCGEQAQAAARWNAVFEQAREWAVPRSLEAWLEDLRATGLLKRLAKQDPERAASLLEDARRVIARLPGGGQTLSTLAATAVGDAHGLDAGRALATLVKRVALVLGHTIEGGSEESDREIWASVGVLVGGALTSTVLALNLPAVGHSTTSCALDLFRAEGEPFYLSLRQLVREPPHWHGHGMSVSVCENPAVVAEAAERLGPSSAPLVCTHGQPGAAVATLLRQLKEAGAELAYHGDFDWPGINIANGVMERFGARPWRFDAAAYRAARGKGKPLSGQPVAAGWDPALMPLMVSENRRVEEEQVLDALLEDLKQAAPAV